MSAGPITLHASCVALEGRAALIMGPSGSGKSALALDLMSRGARLVADDRTEIALRDGHLVATCPPQIAGLIEARGVGLLRAEPLPEAVLALVVDLSVTEYERLPPFREFTLLGHPLALVHRVESGHFSAALMQYLRGGRNA